MAKTRKTTPSQLIANLLSQLNFLFSTRPDFAVFATDCVSIVVGEEIGRKFTTDSRPERVNLTEHEREKSWVNKLRVSEWILGTSSSAEKEIIF